MPDDRPAIFARHDPERIDLAGLTRIRSVTLAMVIIAIAAVAFRSAFAQTEPTIPPDRLAVRHHLHPHSPAERVTEQVD
jgi:hypothetical protein